MRRRLLAGFFLFMLGCTIISRIYDSVTIPKVTTTLAKRKTVETNVEGTGTVTVKEKLFCPVEPGLRIRQTAVIPGSEVKTGDVLFQYDPESVLERKESLQREIEQIVLNMKREEISREPVREMTQEEAARWEFVMAERELEEGQAEFEEILRDHEAKLQRLEQTYIEGMDLAEDELWQQQERDRESARQELESVKSSRDEALRAGERKVEDLEEELDNLSQESEEKRASLEKQLRRAREDLEDLTDSWEEEVDRASARLDLLDYQEDRIRYGQTSIQESRKEAYETAVEQEEDRMDNARKALEEQKKAVEKAQWQLNTARRQDEIRKLSEERQNRISELVVKGLELDKREKEKELARIWELEDQDCQIKAPADGVVADMELTEGKSASGQELVSVSAGDLRFEGTFLKEDQEIAVGDRIEISVPGTQKTKEAVIGRMNLMGETEGIFQADLENLGLLPGTVTSYSCRRQSDIFNKVIPLEGLRKDMKGYYCLVVRPVSTILGEEFRAGRVDVQLLYRGSREAAVEGSLTEKDAVITGENKTIGEGDRVRPVS